MGVRKFSLFCLIFGLIFCVQACAAQAQVTPSGRAKPTETLRVTGNLSVATQTLVVADTATATENVTTLPNVPLTVYAKGGMIWLAGGGNSPRPLTVSRVDPASIDSSPKIADDGKLIAFVRDGDLWLMNVDGGNQRVLTTVFGADFVFSPDGSKIALVSSNKIDVVHTDGSDLRTVFSFDALKVDGALHYIPQVLWLPDGSGFKTVIPGQGVRTRFMFISADGTIVARVAEFDATLSAANRPFISPDGSKVVYTKAHGAELELHIIDAGTADRAYFSHAAEKFGVLGWTLDSAHVLYWADERSHLWLGPQQGDAIVLGDGPNVQDVLWVDAQHYLFVTNTHELRFAALGQPSILMDAGLDESAFDFTVVH